MSINTRILWPICTISALLQWRNNVHTTTWMDLTNNIEWKKPKLTWYTNCMILFLSSGKDRQNSVRSQNNDSAENCRFCFLFWVLHGAECKPGEKSLICTITICSLFSLFRKMLYEKKKKKAGITKGFCVCCSTGTDILQAGLPESGLWVEISIQEIGQDLLLGSHH